MKRKIKGKQIVINVPCLLDLCCGIPFKERENYIIYTYMEENLEYSSYCTLSRKLSHDLLFRTSFIESALASD